MSTHPLPGELNRELVIKPPLAVAGDAPAKSRSKGTWRGLLWCEWFAHSKLLLIFLSAWLVGVWGLPLFAHPGWLLLLGVIYAFLAGPAYGGGDVLEGCEEFSFALPATRSERFLARLMVGGGTLLLFTIMDLLALGLDLSQALTRFYLDTGLIKPLQISKPGLLYGLVLAFPFAIFSFSFACAVLARSRAMVFTAWFWGGLGALALLRAGMQFEEWVWKTMNGYFTGPLLLVFGAGILLVAHRAYRRKEVGVSPAPIQVPVHWWLWVILFVIGLALALLLVTSLVRNLPRAMTG